MRKCSLLMISFILIISCSTKDNELDSTMNLEELSLRFFVDSLLHKVAFKERENSLNYINSALEEELYEPVLFSGKEIYSDGITSSVTIPYMDSVTLLVNSEFFSDYDKKQLTALFKAYRTKTREEFVELNFEMPEEIVFISKQDFERKRRPNSLFLKVKESIKSDDRYYVQLEFLNYLDYPMFDAYSFYIVFDLDGEIINWFVT